MAAPRIYNLINDADAARFGLTPAERNTLLGMCFRNRNGAKPRAIVLHIQDGVTPGSLDWWVNGYVEGVKVQASATVLANKDGSLLRCIPEEHGPWTNGDVNNPKAAAKPLLDLGGNPNIWSLTIEAEGRPWDPMPQAQFDAIVWQVRDWIARYKIPLNMVLPHSAINSVTRANCPGAYYDRLMAVLRAEVPDGPVAPEAPVPRYATADVPDFLKGDVGDEPPTQQLGDVTLYRCHAVLTATAPTPVLKYADRSAPELRPPLAKGETFTIEYIFTGEDRRTWGLSRWGSRIPLTDVSPALIISTEG